MLVLITESVAFVNNTSSKHDDAVSPFKSRYPIRNEDESFGGGMSCTFLLLFLRADSMVSAGLPLTSLIKQDYNFCSVTRSELHRRQGEDVALRV